jgi:pyruvate formate lyase activating enzyme
MLMKTGMIFDIKEFAIHDGPGIRTTVFLKGCPLNCSWCHNPEGKSRYPQIMRTEVSERWVGKETTSEELAKRLNSQAEIFKLDGGGVTFSGGEPLMQAEFVAEVIDLLDQIHVLIDTSGYGNRHDFLQLISRADMVYFDLKIIDPELFREYTGGNIDIVLENLQILSDAQVPFVIRVPLIPGVTDTENNLSSIVKTIRGLPGLIRLDLLPYNRLAGAKYKATGMVFHPKFDEAAELNIPSKEFENSGIPWRVA